MLCKRNACPTLPWHFETGLVVTWYEKVFFTLHCQGAHKALPCLELPEGVQDTVGFMGNPDMEGIDVYLTPCHHETPQCYPTSPCTCYI